MSPKRYLRKKLSKKKIDLQRKDQQLDLQKEMAFMIYKEETVNNQLMKNLKNDLCDATLACEDNQDMTHKLIISFNIEDSLIEELETNVNEISNINVEKFVDEDIQKTQPGRKMSPKRYLRKKLSKE